MSIIAELAVFPQVNSAGVIVHAQCHQVGQRRSEVRPAEKGSY